MPEGQEGLRGGCCRGGLHRLQDEKVQVRPHRQDGPQDNDSQPRCRRVGVGGAGPERQETVGRVACPCPEEEDEGEGGEGGEGEGEGGEGG